MAKTQIRGNQIIPLDIVDAQISASANIASSKLADGANWLKKDGSVAWTAAQNAGNQKLTNLADPTAPQDAATKAYVDATIQGLDVKLSVKAATTANITLSATQTIDGVALVANDRCLVKNQTLSQENGIYIVQSGAWTRATDNDSSTDYHGGCYTFVEQGTANADSGWVVTTDGTITVGTTPVTWVQFSGAGQVIAGAGLLKTANTIDIQATNVSIAVAADSIGVAFDSTAANVELGTNGIRIKRGTSAQVMVANAAGDPVPVTMSGDATITNAGVISVNATNVLKVANFVRRETPSGAINGVNMTYNLAATPVVGSEHFFVNGILQEPGAGNDYTISGAVITMLYTLVVGDKIMVSYLK